MLAVANHNFLLTESRRHYLRYQGGLTFYEVRLCISIDVSHRQRADSNGGATHSFALPQSCITRHLDNHKTFLAAAMQVAVPGTFRYYVAAASRLGLSDLAAAYW